MLFYCRLPTHSTQKCRRQRQNLLGQFSFDFYYIEFAHFPQPFENMRILCNKKWVRQIFPLPLLGHGTTVIWQCSKLSSILINHIHIAHTFHNSTIKLFLINTIKENVIKYYWSIINLLMNWRSSMLLLESLKVEGQTQNTISLLRRTM